MNRDPLRVLRILALVAAPLLPGLDAQDRDAPSPADVRREAAAIDRLIEQDLARHRRTPNPRVDDALFVRRAYLQIVGRQPSLEEARSFLDSSSADRRARLIDDLLASPGRVSHDANFWSDLLRAKSRLQNQVSGEPFLHYLRQSLSDRVPYDDMVREMVTASGAAHARDNGETGYLLRDLGMPDDSMANTVRVFLGTRMECAQCHDHPFDRWKQREFFEMAAFAGGLQYRITDPQQNGIGRELARTAREMRGEDRAATQNFARAARRLLQPLSVGIAGSGTGVTRLPDDYAGEDLRAGAFVAAAPIFDPAVSLPEIRPLDRPRGRARRQNRRLPTHAEIDSRAAFADWLTSPENERFTTVIVNRMFARVFGRGLIEPLDDLRDDTVASNQALLDHLEELMVRLDYDLVEFQRVLLATDAWQRRAVAVDVDADEPFRFEGPVLRRLSAEQLWDSLLVLSLGDVDSTIAPPGTRAERVYAGYEELASLTGDALRERVEIEMLRLTDPQRYRRTVAAERARMRQSMQDDAQQAGRAGRARELVAELRRARVAGDTAKVRELTAELQELRGAPRNRAARGLVRASELPSPAPAGHFLREFGQSDREQTDGAFDDASVPQALALMNGIVESTVMARGSALVRAMTDVEAGDERIRVAFLAILVREPSSAELRTWRRELDGDDGQGWRDLVWTLCNSHEFRFLQ